MRSRERAVLGPFLKKTEDLLKVKDWAREKGRRELRRSYRTVRAQVSAGGLLHVEGSRSSVPIRLGGRHVRVHVYWDELVVTSEREEVARHRRDWKGRGEHDQVERHLAFLGRAPAVLDHGKPFSRMPEWLKRTRETLGEEKGLIQLLLPVEAGRESFKELQEACLEALEGKCVTRRYPERAILKRSRVSEEVPVFEDSEPGRLSSGRFEIESRAVYREILLSAGKEAAWGGPRRSSQDGAQGAPALERCSRECERMETEPAARSLSFEEHLEHLVEHELRTRDSRAVEGRMKAAGFPAIHRLEEYDSKRMAKSTKSFSSSFIAPTGSAAGRTWSRAASTDSGRRIVRSRTVWRPPEKG